ncbi:replicative DNA helicase [Sedimentibacter acidaminivorans]|uniref:DNA 5'-3' helicase n=1 Tax=Sedimentibacter acidaminivorans TaxID=913099 RepID=A0ABS4GDS7_9FIRM|nr:DnaB-like helicase C-terminal domain-containing protein [Sedimentibacter acidaminivorans]MBP1925850.1 replicative DNA helicase [Sedimentibacter acidaminivorans]
MREIQKSLLSTAILYEEQRYLIFGELQEEHFTNEYKTIFKEMKKLYSQRQDIDPVIIMQNLGVAYKDLIADLANPIFIKPNTSQYIKRLKESYYTIQAISQTEELLSNLRQNNSDAEVLQNKYIEISKMFNSNANAYKSYNMTETLNEAYENYNSKENYYKTGFKKLDDTVLISPGDYIIIGGRPSSGKTTFSTNIMQNMATKHKILFFSLETNKINIANKLICSAGKIQLNKILHKSLNDEEQSRYLNTSSELMKLNLEIIEAGGMTVNQIITKSLQRQADIIFIDYLTLVKAESKSLYEKATRISNELHTMAQKNKITIIALSQLKRPDSGKKVSEPAMNDLRESGAIEQDADAIFLLYDPVTSLSDAEQAEKKINIEKQERSLIVAKNKLGRTGKINLNFYGGVQTFYET